MLYYLKWTLQKTKEKMPLIWIQIEIYKTTQNTITSELLY